MTYKHWSFVFFITALCLNILAAYFIVKTTYFINYANHILTFSIMAQCFTFSGIILGILSFSKKEFGDYKKYIGLFGNIVLILLGVISNIFYNG